MTNVDLHMHTTFSDGVSQPDELVAAALRNNLKAIAITDHDNTSSYELALKAAEGTGLELIPGIEINTLWNGKEVHILGYYIDPSDEALQKVIRHHNCCRVTQIKSIVSLIQSKTKLNITFEDIQSKSRDEGTLGRPHVAHAIIEKGGATTISEAFQKYLQPKSPVYVRRETVTPHEAVEVIYECGGIPVVAHPGSMENFEELVVVLMNYGLRGLEAYHRSHSPATIEYHCSLAEKYDLIVTGGTDYHGPADNYENFLKHLKMPDYIYDRLKSEHQQLTRSAFKAS